MTKERRQYSREFKLDAVRLLETNGKRAAEIERELGIGKGNLARWRAEFAENGQDAFLGHGCLTAEQEEMRQLRRRLQIAEQDRHILKRQWPFSRTQADEISVHQGSPGRVPRDPHVQGAGCVAERVLRLAWTTA